MTIDLRPSPGQRTQLERLLSQAHDAYIKDLEALTQSAVDEMEALLGRSPMDARGLVEEYARDSSQLANDYYDTLRGLWSEYGGEDLPDFRHDALIDPDRALWQVQGGFNDADYAGLTYREVKDGRSRAGKTIGDLWPDLSDVDDAQQFIADMIAAAGRLTTQRNIRADPTKPRWARVPKGAVTCAFCVMLASRGFAYLSEESAGLGNAYHPHCDCSIVPSWGRQKLAGYDVDLYRKMWQESGTGDYRTRLSRMRGMYPDRLKDGTVPNKARTSFDEERGILSMKGETERSKKAWDARQRKLGIPPAFDVLEMHEIKFLERFSKTGNHYEWIPQDTVGHTPRNDFHWPERNAEFEVKSMRTAKYDKISKRISDATRKAARQHVDKDHFIIDLGDTVPKDKLIHQLELYNQRSRSPIKELWIFTADGLRRIELR